MSGDAPDDTEIGELPAVFDLIEYFQEDNELQYSTDDEDEKASLRHNHQLIYQTALWVLAAVGIPGNLIVVITVARMRASSTATLLVSVLAVCDLTTLVAKLVFWCLFRYRQGLSDGLCQAEFVAYFLATAANWALVGICIERFISVRYPLRKSLILTRRRCLVAVAATGAVLLPVYASVFCVMRGYDSGERHCGVKAGYADFWLSVWMWLHAALYLALPWLVILGLTAAIMTSLVTARRHRTQLMRRGTYKIDNPANERHLERSRQTERMIELMLIVASLYFLLSALPAATSHFHRLSGAATTTTAYGKRGPTEVTEGDRGLQAERWRLLEQVSFICLDSTHAVNFLLYFLTARRFRGQVMELFCVCRRARCCHGDVATPLPCTASSTLTQQHRVSRDHGVVMESASRDKSNKLAKIQ